MMTTTAAVPPVIGLTSYVDEGQHPHWGTDPGAVIDMRYVRAIERAGAVVVIVPPREDMTDQMAAAVVAGLDGLVVAGGGDVDPARYGQDPHERTGMVRADRDEAELRLVAAARTAALPLLGICRGHQIMAVAAGGRLVQHLEAGDVVHDVTGGFGAHPVQVVPGTRLHAVLGDRVEVATSHHQAVEDAPGYLTSAAADDGVLEAIEDPDLPFCVGVQWHPERADDPRLFDALVAAAVAAR